MRLIELLEKTRLDELRIRYKSEAGGDLSFVAHRDNIWLFDYSEEGEVEDDIMQLTGVRSVDDVRERPDILSGSFDGRTLNVNDLETGMDPRVSTYIKKVAQFLGAEKVEQYQTHYSAKDEELDFSQEYWVHQIGQRVPDEALHGTNTTALPSIMRFGLDPKRGTGNWEEQQGGVSVGKFELIFLSVRPATAMFHAEGSAQKQGGAPVILRVKIPDKDQVGPDYDVAMATGLDPDLADILGFSGSAGWHEQLRQDYVTDQQKLILAKSGQKVWQQSGIFSYRGRIPASHITGIEADLSGEEGLIDTDAAYGGPMYDFGTDMEEFRKAYELYQDHGYWYPDMEAELEAMRDEEEDEEDEDY